MNSYQSPLTERYASSEMSELFSAKRKHTTWRKLWLALAEAQKTLGLPITDAQIAALKDALETVDFPLAEHYEKLLHHDVMAHIHALGDQCPTARPIIHLGATSAFVTDNTDVIVMREALLLLKGKLEKGIRQLGAFAKRWRSQACLGFTHFQPAQLTTVGKRACMWLQDLCLDLQELTFRLEHLRFLGAKGATGTQASFLTLFEGNEKKVQQLELLIAEKFNFNKLFTISGQTYTRKQDMGTLATLSGLAVSCHKFGTDLRLLSHLREIEEPFYEKQVGSSAMPYKRNPILSERLCSLARFVIALSENPTYTAATQWLERSLDDSANRRLSIPEAFLTTDALLELMLLLTSELKVNPKAIQQHIEQELPFLATESILMAAVKKGGDRQTLHEKLRTYSLEEGGDLLHKIEKDASFGLSREELNQILSIEHFIGRAPEQVTEFLNEEKITC